MPKNCIWYARERNRTGNWEVATTVRDRQNPEFIATCLFGSATGVTEADAQLIARAFNELNLDPHAVARRVFRRRRS
jgi:hypothetical protein